MASNKAWDNAGELLAKKKIAETIMEAVKENGHRGLERISAALMHPNDFGDEFGQSDEFEAYCDAASSPRPETYSYREARHDYVTAIAMKNSEKAALASSEYDDEIWDFKPIVKRNKKHMKVIIQYMKALVDKTNGCDITQIELVSKMDTMTLGRFTCEQRKIYKLSFIIGMESKKYESSFFNGHEFSINFHQYHGYNDNIVFSNATDCYRHLIAFQYSGSDSENDKRPWKTVFKFKTKADAIDDFNAYLKERESKKPKERMKRFFGTKK